MTKDCYPFRVVPQAKGEPTLTGEHGNPDTLYLNGQLLFSLLARRRATRNDNLYAVLN